jgi:hypothetical protein
MSPIEALKAEAAAFRSTEKVLGRSIKHSEALEFIAKKHGYESWRACVAIFAAGVSRDNSVAFTVELKRFVSPEWNFALDVPVQWNRFPPVSANSQFEVLRFASTEGGYQLLIVFRLPHDPNQTLRSHSERARRFLAEKGYGNFVVSEATIGTRPALLMNFDKPQAEGVLSCRHFFVAEGTLAYALGFGTTQGQGYSNFTRG